MKRWIRVVGWGGLANGLLLLNGCAFLKKPEPAPLDPIITSATPPQRATDIFDANEGVTHWTANALNAPNDPTKPDKFEITRIDSGEFLWIRSVKTVAAAPAAKAAAPPPAAKPGAKGKAPAPAATPVMVKIYGVPEEVHLAGVITPQPGQPGWADTVNKVKEWTMNALPGSTVIPEVDVEQDPVFPHDLSAPPLRFVQIWFQKTDGKGKATTWNLARMLVHTGYAVADINSPTSLDVKPWFNDEQFARSYIDPKTNKLAPLGLWGKGIILAQRISPPIPKGTKVVVQNIAQAKPDTKGAKSTGGHITVTKTKQVTKTITTSQGGGVATGSPASSPATSSAGNKPSP